MSLDSILNVALSGLTTAQTQLQVVSDNVTNVDTPGYVRKVADQVSATNAGVGAGVSIAGIQLAANSFLETASRSATSDNSSATAQTGYFDQIQSMFGDPSASSCFFNGVAAAFSSFSTVAENPTSSAYLQQSVTAVQQVFSQASSISSGLQQVRASADSQIGADVSTVNSLLSQIETLNNQISRNGVSGQNVSGDAESQQQLLNQLSTLINVKVAPRAGGGVVVRTNDGVELAGDGAATLSYQPTTTVNGQTHFNPISLTPSGGTPVNLADHITSGEIAGLITLRDVQAPQVAAQLGELTSQVAQQLNAASNAHTTAPPPASLTGKTIGLDLASAISGFSGKTTLALTNAVGVIQHQLAITFTPGVGGTVSLDGGAATAFTPASFLATVNGALGALGSASFTNNKLTLSAAGGAGVAVADDATTPSNNGGSGFSAYFGLNDIVQSSVITNYHTGLNTGSASQFGAGGQIALELASGPGTPARDITVSIPAGGTLNSVLTALNDPVTGVGRYGTFGLDATGQLSFTASSLPAPTLNVLSDTTSWAGGASLSRIFGVGQGLRADRASTFNVAQSIQQNPGGLPLASVNLSAAAGTPAVLAGDGSGAQALAAAGSVTTTFAAVAGNAGGAGTVTTYASNVAGAIGQQAAAIKSAQTNAASLQTEATSRLSSAEGVSLDKELTNLTTYQQAYSASSRLVQAAIDMFNTLLSVK